MIERKKYGITPICASEKENIFLAQQIFGGSVARSYPIRKDGKLYNTNDLGHLLSATVVIIVKLREGGI